MKQTKKHKKFISTLMVILSFICISYLQAFYLIPGKIILFENQDYLYDFKSPYFVNVKTDENEILKFNDSDIRANGSYLPLSGPIDITTQNEGRVSLVTKLFGLIPFKTIHVDVLPYKGIIPCGNTIGVKMKMDGVLVIGLSDVETADGDRMIPAKEAGIKTGDMIVEINGIELNTISALSEQIENSSGNELDIKYRRGESFFTSNIKPIKAGDDKKFHLGLWVRDNTAGIGTLTFYDPESGAFGALGHGIADIDTGLIMPISDGEILEINILAIKRGQAGHPGELKGVFADEGSKFGDIFRNCEFGIYGYLNDNLPQNISQKQYRVALKNQVRQGSAIILANIAGKEIEEFSIQILKVINQSDTTSKNMMIKITDSKIIEKTGGIVQGMSGCPIIQDDKIIGAITHVLVNDPTRGYGIFIENMLKNIADKNQKSLEKAS